MFLLFQEIFQKTSLNEVNNLLCTMNFFIMTPSCVITSSLTPGREKKRNGGNGGMAESKEKLTDWYNGIRESSSSLYVGMTWMAAHATYRLP